MLSLFPQLFDWNWYVPFGFRMFIACYLISVGYHFAKQKKSHGDDRFVWMIFGTLLVLLGIAFLVGIYVQLAGAVGFVLAMTALYFKQKKAAFAHESRKFYLLIGLVSLSLIFLGPGPYAFDLPL